MTDQLGAGGFSYRRAEAYRLREEGRSFSEISLSLSSSRQTAFRQARKGAMQQREFESKIYFGECCTALAGERPMKKLPEMIAECLRLVGELESAGEEVSAASKALAAGLKAEPVTAFIGIKRVRAISGFSKATIHRKIKAGQFPAPVIAEGNCTRWDLAEVLAWRAEQFKKREARGAHGSKA